MSGPCISSLHCGKARGRPFGPPRVSVTTRNDVVAIMTLKTTMLDAIKMPCRSAPRQRKTTCSRLPTNCAAETISAVAVTGGHLGAGLGVVELTVALHYVFDTPNDRLIWDVGHQAYPHKILTGRRDRIRTLRQGGGLSGFTKRAESEYDCFGAAHSSTSISAGLGMAVARDLAGEKRQCHRRDRRRRDVGRHGLRGDEQCRRDEFAPDRHPQRQRHVDRAAGRRDVGLSGAADLRPHLSVAARDRQAARAAPAEVRRGEGAARRGICARHRDRRHAVRGARLLLCRPDRRPQSRSPAAGAARTCATPRTARSSFTS